MIAIEEEIPVSILKAIQDDLLKLTQSIVKLGRTPFGNVYKLSELEPLIDEARRKIAGALNEHTKKKNNTLSKIDSLVKYIQDCRYILQKMCLKLEDFCAQKITPNHPGEE